MRTKVLFFIIAILVVGIGCEEVAENTPAELQLPRQQESKLYRAVLDGNIATVKELIKAGEKVDKESLQLAAQNGHIDIVKELIKTGAPVDNGKSIELAAQNAHHDIVKELITAGTPVTLKALDIAQEKLRKEVKTEGAQESLAREVVTALQGVIITVTGGNNNTDLALGWKPSTDISIKGVVIRGKPPTITIERGNTQSTFRFDTGLHFERGKKYGIGVWLYKDADTALSRKYGAFKVYTPLPFIVGEAAAQAEAVKLSWTPSSNTSVTGYKIQQIVYSNTTDIAVNGRSTASHTITGLTAGREHRFTIFTVAEGKEVQLGTVRVTPRRDAPPNLAVRQSGNSAILTWDAPSYFVNDPLVEYSLDSYNIHMNGKLLISVKERTYTVTGMTTGTAYTFTITATLGSSRKYGDRTSVHSAPVTITIN